MGSVHHSDVLHNSQFELSWQTEMHESLPVMQENSDYLFCCSYIVDRAEVISSIFYYFIKRFRWDYQLRY